MNDPITDLQERLAHQEIAIEVLNETVARQDRVIDDLRRDVAALRERLQALQPSPLGDNDSPEPAPPHY
jgi:SlyX protein